MRGSIVYDADTRCSGRAWGDTNRQNVFKRAPQRCLDAGRRRCSVPVPIHEGCAVVAQVCNWWKPKGAGP